METIKKFGLAVLIIASSFSACEKSDLKPETSNLNTKEMLAIPVWTPTAFQWRNGERNDQFAEHFFRFENNGIVSVIHGDEREFGKWSRSNTTMTIRFENPPLNLLNNRWTILEESRAELKLGGLSPYDNMAEILAFENMSMVDAH